MKGRRGEVRGGKGEEGKERSNGEGRERRRVREEGGSERRGRCYLLTASIQPYGSYPAYSKSLYYNHAHTSSLLS